MDLRAVVLVTDEGEEVLLVDGLALHRFDEVRGDEQGFARGRGVGGLLDVLERGTLLGAFNGGAHDGFAAGLGRGSCCVVGKEDVGNAEVLAVVGDKKRGAGAIFVEIDFFEFPAVGHVYADRAGAAGEDDAEVDIWDGLSEGDGNGKQQAGQETETTHAGQCIAG